MFAEKDLSLVQIRYVYVKKKGKKRKKKHRAQWVFSPRCRVHVSRRWQTLVLYSVLHYVGTDGHPSSVRCPPSMPKTIRILVRAFLLPLQEERKERQREENQASRVSFAFVMIFFFFLAISVGKCPRWGGGRNPFPQKCLTFSSFILSLCSFALSSETSHFENVSVWHCSPRETTTHGETAMIPHQPREGAAQLATAPGNSRFVCSSPLSFCGWVPEESWILLSWWGCWSLLPPGQIGNFVDGGTA